MCPNFDPGYFWDRISEKKYFKYVKDNTIGICLVYETPWYHNYRPRNLGTIQKQFTLALLLSLALPEI